MNVKFTSLAVVSGLLFVTALVAAEVKSAKAEDPKPHPAAQTSHPAEQSDAGGAVARSAAKPVDDFTRIDTDRDGRVSAKEYAASEFAALDMIAAGKLSGSESPRGGFDFVANENRPDRSKFFRRLDADGDGYISRDELEAGKTRKN